MNSPKVSVVIPNYNREKLIGETIENLLRQTLKPYQIIVVDDGSTDGSVEVIRQFGDKVQLVEQENQGPGSARNAGLEQAEGDFIQFFDSDDLCSLNKLEVQARALIRDNADVVYGPWLPVVLENNQASLRDHVIQQAPAVKNLHYWLAFLRGWAIVFQTCMFRHSFLREIGQYRTDLMPSEDSEFFFRMLIQDPVIVYEPEGLVLYRLHEFGQITVSGTSVNQRTEDWARYISCIEDELQRWGGIPDWVTFFLWGYQCWKSAVDCKNKGIGSDPGGAIKISTHYIYTLFSKLREWNGGIRSRIYGSRYNRYCKAAPIREFQRILVKQLGYEARSE